jgi:hypothetical protein
MQNNFKSQKLVLLSILLLVLFIYPVISIASKPLFVAGIPLLYGYIFFVWVTAIIISYRLADRNKKENDE